MSTKRTLFAGVLLLSASCGAFADRPLERAEILQIFQQLTSQPRKTWIPAGTIEATHQEYRAPKTTDPNEINRQINDKIREYQANQNKPELTENLQKMTLDAIPFNVRYRLSNEYTMSSTVVVRFDGERFYWEINVDSRTDSVERGEGLSSNYMTKHFDLEWNARRIFAWDGEKYTTYSLPGNHAIVDAAGTTPHVVTGPLTAGVIPWGHGYFTYENLEATKSSALETYVNGQAQIQVTLANSDGSQVLFVLDPGKAYSAMSCSITGPGNFLTSKQYSNYQYVSGHWVPTTISIEKYDAGSNRLLTSDSWTFTAISGDAPAPESLNVQYEADALIEYFSDVTARPAIYRYSRTVDTTLLLSERLAFAASEGTQAQNCATAALKHALTELGQSVTDDELAQLVRDPNKDTSLLQMKQFIQGRGLYCRTVRTDIQTLKSLEGCEIILHIPGKKHFIVVDTIDGEYVWTVDLASDKFYYRTAINFFGMDWTEGTALLVSRQPIPVQGNYTEIDDDQLGGIIGAAGYSCTRLLQTYNVIFCGNPVVGVCEGYYEEYYTRYGCKAAPSGSCSGSRMLRYKESPCIVDPYDPFACTVTGEWTSYYMLACA
jgi:hypothetical protein